MKSKHHRLIAGIAWSCLSVGLPALGQFPGQQPYRGVTFQALTRTDPPMRLFVAEVDLTARDIRVEVAPGGPDPDGPGEWEATLSPPTAVAAREKFDLVINGDFFSVPNDPATSKPAGYRTNVWAAALGPAVSNGKTWSTTRQPRPCLAIRKDKRALIAMLAKPGPEYTAVISGNVMLVDDGKAVPQTNKDRHPRTVVGVDAKGTRLTILVVDGRRPGVSIGMSYEELAKEMLRLRCHDALNLDGGGSTVMAFREPKAGSYAIVNQPSDGKERPVVNVLGVRATKPEPRKR